MFSSSQTKSMVYIIYNNMGIIIYYSEFDNHPDDYKILSRNIYWRVKQIFFNFLIGAELLDMVLQ